MKSCVFAGSFDPITLGHEAIIEKCLETYQKVLVVIGENPNKTPFFSSSERRKIISAVYKDNDRVKVVEYSKQKQNYSDFLISEGVTDYVRGIRNEKDLEYESKSIEYNKKAYPFMETKFIDAPKSAKEISSTLVREYLEKGLSVDKYLSKIALKEVKEILKKK